MNEISQKQRIRNCRVVPVLTIHDASLAVDMAKAFIAGGIDVLEITLRTPAGLDAIEKIRSSELDCFVGAGTVLTEGDIQDCQSAGAEFLVTPATPISLIDPLLNYSGLVLPGTATPTEALTLYQIGFHMVKFFPAEAAGGATMLKSLASPMPNISFMPTGGIKLETAPEYLALPNVVAVGGSWLCTDSDMSSRDWDAVERKAREASTLA